MHGCVVYVWYMVPQTYINNNEVRLGVLSVFEPDFSILVVCRTETCDCSVAPSSSAVCVCVCVVRCGTLNLAEIVTKI